MKNVLYGSFILLVFAIFSLTGCIQEEEKISVEWIYSQEGKQVAVLPSFAWLEDGTAIMYDSLKPEQKRTFSRLSLKNENLTDAINAEKAMASLKKLGSKDDLPKGMEWPIAFDGRGERALYLYNDDIFLLDLVSSKFIRVTSTEGKEKSARFSPDGDKIAFVRDNNLFVFDIGARTEKQLTDDGSETLLNGTLSWVYWEEVFFRNDIGYWWSNDSTAIAFLQTDESLVSLMHYVDFKPYVPRIIKQRYPKVGTDNPVVRVGVVEIENGNLTWGDFENTLYEYIIRVKWLPDDVRLSVQTLNRDQTELDLYFVSRVTGKSVHILKERDDAWVNIHDDLHFLKDSKGFIWTSERDGYMHLYLYTMAGELQCQVSKGDWTLCSSGSSFELEKAVAAIDEEEGWIYFSALEKSSIERHLYRIHFDGTGMERLTEEDGVHRIDFCQDGTHYVDNFSNISTLPSLSLYTNSGEFVRTITPPRPGELAKYDVQQPELLTIPAKDGFMMPAMILKPQDFDVSKKYPVIIPVYGGPSAPTVSNSWKSSILFDQMLLDKGYLVLRVDNRSATGISKKLTSSILHEIYGSGELNDLIDAVKWLKKQDFVDPGRVGIWGWSGGGVFTLLGMTHSKEFRAGIAVAPVTDHRHYDTKNTEAYMKKPEENPDGYEKTSLVNTAKNLHGRLLIVHGTYDDNVHPQNTWAFIDELIKANKMFDLMIYPMRKHGISDDPARIHLYNTMLKFWIENL